MQHTSQHKPIYYLRNLLPSPGNVIFTIFMIGITLWAQSVGAISLGAMTAQTSVNMIPYQGYLTDADNKPLSGKHDMKFCLYENATGGASLWCEQWSENNQVQLNDGLFTVSLGSQNAISQNIIADNKILFLGATIGADNELTPRIQIGRGIGAMIVPDGSITSRHVKLQHGRIVANFATPTIELPNTFTEIDSTRVEITLDTPQTLIVIGVFDFQMSNGTTTSGRLSVNGNLTGNSAIQSNGRGTVSQTWLVNLDAGKHTLFLVGRRAIGSGISRIVEHHTTMTWFSFSQ